MKSASNCPMSHVSYEFLLRTDFRCREMEIQWESMGLMGRTEEPSGFRNSRNRVDLLEQLHVVIDKPRFAHSGVHQVMHGDAR